MKIMDTLLVMEEVDIPQVVPSLDVYLIWKNIWHANMNSAQKIQVEFYPEIFAIPLNWVYVHLCTSCTIEVGEN